MRQARWLPSRRGAGLAISSCVAATLLSLAAQAQPKPGASPSRPSDQPLRLERGEGGDAQAARGRARAGDCKSALPSFDAALRTRVEPSLYRDRGLCHEQLGNLFPAMDDYRVYLTARPDAPDADRIRERLAALEEQTGAGGRSSRAAKEPAAKEPAAADSASASAGAGASLSIGSRGARASARTRSTSSAADESSGEGGLSYDEVVEREKTADMANASPLRYGSGIVLGPFVHVPRFYIGEGAQKDLAYGAGLALRYSTGRLLSLVSEIGYAGIGRSGEATEQSGPLLMGGLELRLPISAYAGDHLLLRGGVGFERYVVSGTRAINSLLLGRFAFGYRHVFGPAVGLEFLADGGPAVVFPENRSTRFNALVGGSVAFVVGF